MSLQAGPRAGYPGAAPTGPSEPALPAPRPGPAEGCGQGRRLRGSGRGVGWGDRVLFEEIELSTSIDVLVTCI